MKNITKIVVASHNEGKVREIRDLLAPFGVETVSAGELGLTEPEETETTFIGNAGMIAALRWMRWVAIRAFTPRAGPRNPLVRAEAAILIWRCGM
jgi:hypothetical protein